MKTVILLGVVCLISSTLNLISGAAISPTQEILPIREARIILPHRDNDGVELIEEKNGLEVKLIELCGGFTRATGYGGWDSNAPKGRSSKATKPLEILTEEVWIYDVACTNSEQNDVNLTDVAVWLRNIARQQSVYLRLPNGNVTFI